MKSLNRLIFSTIVLFCTLTNICAQQAFYVYRNDGVVNGFITSDIDSMVCSRVDVDSILHESYQVQEIWTSDSVYRIPLAAIDSVGYVTPKTVYQPGVINLSEHLMQYVIDCDSLAITFSSSTPAQLLPKQGDKLVTLELSELFPVGFAGEVRRVGSNGQGIVVECDGVNLEDIFEVYYNVASIYGYQTEASGAKKAKGLCLPSVDEHLSKTFQLGETKLSCSAELSHAVAKLDDLAFSFGSSLESSIKPSVHINATLIMNKENGTYFSATMTGDILSTTSVGVSGGLKLSKDFLDKELIKIPVCPFVYYYICPGLFINADATASVSLESKSHYTFGMGFDFSTKGQNLVKPSIGGRLLDSSMDVKGCVDGRIALGGFVESGYEFLLRDISRVCVRGELGTEFVGDLVLINTEVDLAKSETKMYERLQNSSFEWNAFASLTAQASYLKWGESYSLPFSLSYNLRTWDMVPSFTDVTLKPNEELLTSFVANANVTGECLFPVNVGFSLRNSEGKEFGTFAYKDEFKQGNLKLNETFKDVSLNKNYTLFPTVKFMGVEVLASPSDKEMIQVIPKTYKVEEVTTTGADAYGKCLELGKLTNQEYGICYAKKDESPSWSFIQGEKVGEMTFKAALNNLETNTEYVYMAYLLSDGEYYYGEQSSFKTLRNVKVVTQSYSVSENSLKMEGTVGELSKEEIAEAGFYYGLDKDKLDKKGTCDTYWDAEDVLAFSASITIQESVKALYYRAYVLIDGVCYYGEICKAKLQDDNKEGLMNFFKTSGGDKWTNHEGWGANYPVEKWHGISDYGSGMYISLANNNLTGNAELHNIDKIIDINLDGNAFSSLSVKDVHFQPYHTNFFTVRNNKKTFNLQFEDVDIMCSDFTIHTSGASMSSARLNRCIRTYNSSSGNIIFNSDYIGTVDICQCNNFRGLSGYWPVVYDFETGQYICSAQKTLQTDNIIISECNFEEFYLNLVKANNVRIANVNSAGFLRINGVFSDFKVANTKASSISVNAGKFEYAPGIVSPATSVGILTLDNVHIEEIDVSGSVGKLVIKNCEFNDLDINIEQQDITVNVENCTFVGHTSEGRMKCIYNIKNSTFDRHNGKLRSVESFVGTFEELEAYLKLLDDNDRIYDL